MKKAMHLIVASVLMIGLLSTVVAADKKADELDEYYFDVSGEIVRVDATAHTFVLKEILGDGSMTRELDFGLCNKPRFMIRGKSVPFVNLKVGEKVTVYYHAEKGKLEAHEVTTE